MQLFLVLLEGSPRFSMNILMMLSAGSKRLWVMISCHLSVLDPRDTNTAQRPALQSTVSWVQTVP